MTNDYEPTNDSLEGEEEVQGSSWDDVSDSEMAAARTAEESYALEGGKKRLNRGAIIFMASCVICIGGFYLFHLKQKPQKASAQQQEVEEKLDKALNKLVDKKEQEKSRKLFEDTEEMVQAFYEYPAKQQVALKELQRNPFSSMLAKDDEATDVDDAKERQEKLRVELTKKVGGLQLQSVLQGPRGAQCLINGDVYGEGEKVAETFVIKSISEGKVVLVAQEMDFTLQM
jgi:hypothetical protein